MKQVQTALADIGIPVMAGIWKDTGTGKSPGQYIVYSSTTGEMQHADDGVLSYRTFIYMDLWSQTDPTPMRDKVRECMYAAGFGMVEETDRGYRQPAYDHETDMYAVQWTWLYVEEVVQDGADDRGLR